MSESDEELAYYRAVEDFFAAMRGVVHQLSPKDFQLLRQWWRDKVPLRAVTSGIAEVINKRRAEDQEPAVSLSFCRHAVKRNAKRLSEMRVGAAGESPDAVGADPATVASLTPMLHALEVAAQAQEQHRPEVARAVHAVMAHLEKAGEMPAEALEELLFSLEIAMLDTCRRALTPEEQQQIEASARAAAEQTGATGGSLQRTLRAMVDRDVRRLLDLPRLELD